METLDTCIQMMHENYFMASLDLKDAYFSIPIDEKSIKYFKFNFHGTTYAFRSLPQGFKDSPRVFTKIMKPDCILVHFIPLPVFIFYSFTGIYILLILFLYSILSTLFPCTLYGLIFPFLFLYFYSIFVYSFSLFSVPAWMGLYRRGWDYTAWSVFV